MKTEFIILDKIGEIVKGVKKGALVTTKVGNKVNCMTISWGNIGIEWNKLIFTTYVRTGRFTHKMLEDSGEFTVNIGGGQDAAKIKSFCGSKSGADFDKVTELNLELVEGLNIVTPGIKQLPMTLECKVIYKQLQDIKAISEEIRSKFYLKDVGIDSRSANHAPHTMFFGEIVGAYIAK